MKRPVLLFLFALGAGTLGAVGPPAGAAELSVESRTYVPARGTEDEETHVLLYEYLSVGVDGLGRGLYLQAAGWGRTDLADETYGQTTNGDLQYAYLGWRAPVLNAEARAGRVALTAGVARNEVFDGLLLGSDLPAGFDVTIFGGIPVEVDENGRSGDSLYGGRLSQGRRGLYRIGASYLREEDDGDIAREEAGSDLSFTPLPLVEITGTSLYNVTDDAWARHSYRLILGPFRERVRITGTWTSTDYRHYFTASDMPAFPSGEDEKLDRIGGEVWLALGRGLSLTGEYASYQYDLSGEAEAYGAVLGWSGGGASAGGGYRRVHGDAEEDRYQQFSLYGATTLRGLRVSLDAEHLDYEEPINGEETATTATLALGYTLATSFEVTLSGEYGQTPEYEHEVKGMLAVLWRYDATSKKGGTK